jgi:hypothetical protein
VHSTRVERAVDVGAGRANRKSLRAHSIKCNRSAELRAGLGLAGGKARRQSPSSLGVRSTLKQIDRAGHHAHRRRLADRGAIDADCDETARTRLAARSENRETCAKVLARSLRGREEGVLQFHGELAALEYGEPMHRNHARFKGVVAVGRRCNCEECAIGRDRFSEPSNVWLLWLDDIRGVERGRRWRERGTGSRCEEPKHACDRDRHTCTHQVATPLATAARTRHSNETPVPSAMPRGKHISSTLLSRHRSLPPFRRVGRRGDTTTRKSRSSKVLHISTRIFVNRVWRKRSVGVLLVSIARRMRSTVCLRRCVREKRDEEIEP